MLGIQFDLSTSSAHTLAMLSKHKVTLIACFGCMFLFRRVNFDRRILANATCTQLCYSVMEKNGV